MLSGNILDCYVDTKTNTMVTWLSNQGKAARILDRFEPCFYVYASPQKLYGLAASLQDIPQVKQLNFTKKKLTLGSEKTSFVLEVTPKRIGSLQRLAAMIDEWGHYNTYELFNVDCRLATRYLQSKGVFCNAQVRWDGTQFLLQDEQWAIDYPTPQYTTLFFDITRKPGVQPMEESITRIFLDDTTIEEDNEADTLLAAVQEIRRRDPDIIFTKQGDDRVLPYFHHRAQQCGIADQIHLGRDAQESIRPSKQAKSYFSYGQIVYRPAFYTLKGRAHLDMKSSFMYSESGLRGIIDISRCANISLQLQSRLGPGTSISQMQINKAVAKGYLIPWKKNMPEQPKTAWQLLVSDRGGLILSPVPGIHDDVVELDYASLYPNIMLRFNISPETMLCDCCPDSAIRVPQLGYHICEKQKGLIPEVLQPILHRRFCFKARTKNSCYDPQLYQEIQQAWKWVLIVCFGYTGYRNARYGRIECHESITAFARDIILDAVAVAEQQGYEVLHGIVDSLWVKAQSGCTDPRALSRRISEKTGVKMDVEGRYKWIVFLPSKQFDVGALNRYYGVFETGELKVRGIELRQRNTPEILRAVQREMFTVLTTAETAAEFMALIPAALDAMLHCATHVINRSVDPAECVFTTRISKEIPEYKVNTLTKAALLQLRDMGVTVAAGQSIQYVVTNERSRHYRDRVCVIESLDDDTTIDVDFYLRQIAKCVESIFVPFGFTLEELYEVLLQWKRKEEVDVSVLPRMRTIQTCL